jgi:hypothetical protein
MTKLDLIESIRGKGCEICKCTGFYCRQACCPSHKCTDKNCKAYERLHSTPTPRPNEGWEERFEAFVHKPSSFLCVKCGLNFPGYCRCHEPKPDIKDRTKIFISTELAKKDEEIANWKLAKEELQKSHAAEIAKAREEGIESQKRHDEEVIGQLIEAPLTIAKTARLDERSRFKEELRGKIEDLRPNKPYPNASNGYARDLDPEDKAYDQAIADVLKIVPETNQEELK